MLLVCSLGGLFVGAVFWGGFVWVLLRVGLGWGGIVGGWEVLYEGWFWWVLGPAGLFGRGGLI